MYHPFVLALSLPTKQVFLTVVFIEILELPSKTADPEASPVYEIFLAVAIFFAAPAVALLIYDFILLHSFKSPVSSK